MQEFTAYSSKITPCARARACFHYVAQSVRRAGLLHVYWPLRYKINFIACSVKGKITRKISLHRAMQCGATRRDDRLTSAC